MLALGEIIFSITSRLIPQDNMGQPRFYAFCQTLSFLSRDRKASLRDSSSLPPHVNPMTKTEQEYYSRVVKKKLEALADSEVKKIAVAPISRLYNLRS